MTKVQLHFKPLTSPTFFLLHRAFRTNHHIVFVIKAPSMRSSYTNSVLNQFTVHEEPKTPEIPLQERQKKCFNMNTC